MTRLSAPSAFVLAAAMLLPGATPVFACACCVDRGYRFERPGDELEANQVSELEGLTFAQNAKLRTTAAFPDDIKGFEPTADDDYKIAVRREQGIWRFDITDSKGGTGTLSFKLPKIIDRFEIDFPAEDNASDEPSLVKEWRIVAPVSGEGMFKAGLSKSARVRLILQGRGNMCTSGSDFQSWQLVVSGPRESFSFMGKVD